MGSINRLNATFGMMPAELNLAVASLNLDFTLCKFEAPPEYHGLGDSLTKHRKEEAEDGPLHRTARRLGALFDVILPSVPHLIAAYGKRVSDISSKSAEKMATETLFAKQSGLDGGTIWAAATSGRGAIAVHLLACMLARMWNESEAISVWMELIATRKTSIMSENDTAGDNPANIATLFAAKQDFSRQQIASWDASARAWIQTANSDRKLQQTQLMLVLNNLTIPINTELTVYDSVTKAWTGAMTMLDRLIQGMPQRLSDGAVLLGMSSWHLYPTLVAISSEMKCIDQKDELFEAGGVLTVGLEGRDLEKESGLSWSLPLAYMQYYAAPVKCQRRLAGDTSRVSMQHFAFVVLGSVVSAWPKANRDTKALFNMLIALRDYISSTKSSVEFIPEWFLFLASTVNQFLNTSGLEEKQAKQLYSLGFRRGISFLVSATIAKAELFGILQFKTLLFFVHTNEERIKLFRHLLQRRSLSNRRYQGLQMMIRTQNTPSNTDFIPYELASIFPSSYHTLKRSLDGDPKTAPNYVRYIFEIPAKNSTRNKGCCHGNKCDCNSGTSGLLNWRGPQIVSQRHTECLPDPPTCSNTSRIPFECTSFCDRVTGLCPPCTFSKRCEDIERTGETFKILPESYYDSNGSFYLSDKTIPYTFLLGDASTAAIFTQKRTLVRSVSKHRRDDLEAVTVEEFSDLLGMQLLDAGLIAKHLERMRKYSKPTAQPLENRHETRPRSSSRVNINDSISFKSLRKASGSTLIEEGWKGQEEEMLSLPTFVLPSPVEEEDNGKLNDFHFWPSSSRGSPEFTLDGGAGPRDAFPHKHKAEALHGETSSSTSGRIRSLSHAVDIAKSMSVLYDLMPDATISLSACVRPLTVSRWSYDLVYERPSSSNRKWRASAFGCIAMYESEGFDIDPERLRDVMALSAGDSIYLIAPLVSDPCSDRTDRPIRRILGNLGSSGISLLVAPTRPRTLELDNSRWHMINHAAWDGRLEDSFTGTSLHLSFTDFEMPVDVGLRGLRDTPVKIMEALVSVYDKSQWIADLDVLSLLDDKRCMFVRSCDADCSVNDIQSKPRDVSSDGRVVSVDNWAEYLDGPETLAVFQARGNWQARLAAAAISSKNRRPTAVIPPSKCYKCSRVSIMKALKTNIKMIVA